MVPLVELEQQHCIVWECVHFTQQHQPGHCKICHPDQSPHYLTQRPADWGPEIEAPHKQEKGVDNPDYQTEKKMINIRQPKLSFGTGGDVGQEVNERKRREKAIEMTEEEQQGWKKSCTTDDVTMMMETLGNV
eukprot:superscaffoldBa00000439_g4736